MTDGKFVSEEDGEGSTGIEEEEEAGKSDEFDDTKFDASDASDESDESDGADKVEESKGEVTVEFEERIAPLISAIDCNKILKGVV